MEIKLFFDLDEKLKYEWLELEKNNFLSTPFNQYEWVKLYCDIVKPNINNKYLFVVAYKNEKVFAILPLVIKKKIIKRIEFIGYPFNDINVPIINCCEKLDKLEIIELKSKIINKLHKFADFIFFNNQPDYIHSFKNEYVFKDKIVNKHQNYKINVKEFISRIRKNNMSKKLARIQNKYKDFKIYDVEEEIEIEKIYQFFFKFKFKQLEKTGKRNFLKKDEYKNFTKACFLSSKIRKKIYSLKFKNKLIATFFGYHSNKSFFYIFPTFDTDYSNLSPGNLIIKLFIENYNDKITYFDFTVGDEMYKKQWSSEYDQLIDSVYCYNIIGYIYLFFYSLKNKIKNIHLFNKIINLLRKLNSKIC